MALLYEATASQKQSDMAHVVNGSHSFTCHPCTPLLQMLLVKYKAPHSIIDYILAVLSVIVCRIRRKMIDTALYSFVAAWRSVSGRHLLWRHGRLCVCHVNGCLSVTLMYCAQTTESIIMRRFRACNPAIPVYPRQTRTW